MKKICRQMGMLVLAVLLVLTCATPVLAFNYIGNDTGEGYASYIYDIDGNMVAAPAAFTGGETVTGEQMGTKALRDPEDLFYDRDAGYLYVADTGNDRVLVLDGEFRLVRELTTYTDGEESVPLTAPSAICVRDGLMYVADSSRQCLVVFHTADWTVSHILRRPEVALLEADYAFDVTAIGVDYSGRVYLTLNGVNQGLMQLGSTGEFIRFIGAPSVVPDVMELLWRKFLTEEQIKQRVSFIPTEYNSIHIDDDGFIYVTSQSVNLDSNQHSISRLNSMGTNILQSGDAYPIGDGDYISSENQSVIPLFVDIVSDAHQNYYVLDSATCRIFAYEANGNLMYAFGNNGALQSMLSSPTAIELVGDAVVVLDKTKRALQVFYPTEYARLIETGYYQHRMGWYEEAVSTWEQVREYNGNYDYAIIALAKSAYKAGRYREAMDSLRHIGEKAVYSRVFEIVRNDFLRAWFFPIFLAVVLCGVLCVVGLGFIKKLKPVQKLAAIPLVQQIRYSTYVMFHPFDGFWDLKHEKRGSVRSATILYGLFLLCYGVRVRYSGYLFMQGTGRDVNVLFELVSIALLLTLLVVCNWCFTTLMDGEGSMRNLYIATAYALTPYTVMSPILFGVSHFFTAEEAGFYTYLQTFAILWCVLLLVLGYMMTHNYGIIKNLVSCGLTIVGIAICLFLALLTTSIVQNAADFIVKLYQELSFRLY